jgi:hypothetical protein
VQVSGEGAELTHRLGVPVRRNRYEVAILSAVDAGRIRLDAFEQRDRGPRCALLRARLELCFIAASSIVELAEGAADRTPHLWSSVSCDLLDGGKCQPRAAF